MALASVRGLDAPASAMASRVALGVGWGRTHLLSCSGDRRLTHLLLGGALSTAVPRQTAGEDPSGRAPGVTCPNADPPAGEGGRVRACGFSHE